MIDPSRGYHCKIATRSHELRTIGIPVWTLFSISLARLSSRYHEFVSTHTILRRLQMAQAEGLAPAMAEVVEADAEPIDGVLTDREGPKEGECERCSPRFYFRLGAVVAVIVLLSIVIPVAITESGGFNDDSRGDPGLSKFLQPVSWDIAYPLEGGEDPIFASLTVGAGPNYESDCFRTNSTCRGKSDGSLLTLVRVVHLHSMRLYVSRFRNLWERQIYLLRCSQAIARIGHAFQLMDAYYQVIAETLLGLWSRRRSIPSWYMTTLDLRRMGSI